MITKRPHLKSLICLPSPEFSDKEKGDTIALLLGMTGAESLAVAFSHGYCELQIDRIYKAKTGSTLRFLSNMSQDDKVIIFEAKRAYAEMKLEEIRDLTLDDIEKQYSSYTGIPEDEEEALQQSMKLAMLVEKRVKNNEIAIRSFQRTIERYDRLINSDKKELGDGLIIENSVIMNNAVLGLLPSS